MIRILNCLKTTPDSDQVPESEWLSGIQSGIFDFSYLKREIDTFSESGLELTLRLKDAAKADEAHLSALTVGPKAAEKALRTLLALGFDECVRIDRDPLYYDAETTAEAIADYCTRCGDYDVIVFGAESPDGRNRKTPLLVAEHLGMPLLQNVSAFTLAEGGIRISHVIPEGDCEETIPVPVVLVVENVPETLLRVPTLMQRRSSMNREISVVEAETSPAPSMQLEKLEYIDQERSGSMIDETDPQKIAQILYDEYIRRNLK